MHIFSFNVLIVFQIGFTLSLLVPSADNLCKQFGRRSGLTIHLAWCGSRLFDTLLVFLKDFYEKVNFEKKNQTDDKKQAKLPRMP